MTLYSKKSSNVLPLICGNILLISPKCYNFNNLPFQCYNRGFDGQDVQWECKADMDNLYRFGSVEVVCEGYDYPDDPYILKGSCGLEYTLELTKEGQNKNQGMI